MTGRKLTVWLLGWRISLSLIVIAGVLWLPFKPTFSAAETLDRYGPRSLTTWANFDGVHYLTIAAKGYLGTGLIQAFFPVYPILIKLLGGQVINPLVIGIMISTISAGLGLWFLEKLVRLDEPSATGQRTIILYLLFPTAFFLTAVYNEGLFFLLVVLTFYLSRRQRWVWAGWVGTLAAATRLIGVILVPCLLIEFFMYSKSKMVFSRNLLWCCLPIMGLVGYMIYLGTMFHDPLLFYHVQQAFGAGRNATTLILLPQVFYRYLKILLTLQPDIILYYRTIQELLSAILGLWLVILAFPKTRLSYAIFALGGYLLPTLTGTFSSLPRYLLPLFPLFIVISKVKAKWVYITLLIAFGILQVVNLLLFTGGQFVA